MINFRVRDLDTFLSELRGKGVKVYPETQIEPYGKFGWVEDPDGNKIELWEPTS
jgi:predicted enzyme related to lactoylglutathione lyase